MYGILELAKSLYSFRSQDSDSLRGGVSGKDHTEIFERAGSVLSIFLHLSVVDLSSFMNVCSVPQSCLTLCDLMD